SLAEEYVYAALCEAAMHAFVAENEARAAAMLRARGKVQEMLAALHVSENRVRQEAITAEIVELAALRGRKEGQGLCPWTPPKAEPLESIRFSGLSSRGRRGGCNRYLSPLLFRPLK